MKPNMGAIDKTVRILLAGVVAVLYLTGVLGGVAAAVLGGLAVIFVATSLISFCPLYLPFGFSTCKKEEPTGAEES